MHAIIKKQACELDPFILLTELELDSYQSWRSSCPVYVKFPATGFLAHTVRMTIFLDDTDIFLEHLKYGSAEKQKIFHSPEI